MITTYINTIIIIHYSIYPSTYIQYNTYHTILIAIHLYIICIHKKKTSDTMPTIPDAPNGKHDIINKI